MQDLGLIKRCLDFFSIQLDFLKDILPTNWEPYVDFLPIFLLATLFALFVTPIIGFFAKKYDILDYPAKLRKKKLNKHDREERHIHKEPTPLLGGLSFVLPIVLLLLFLLSLNISPVISAILAGVFILTIVGILDDIFNLPASYQLAGQILAAVIIALSPINMNLVNLPMDGFVSLDWYTLGLFVFPGDLVMILWILLCINAIKFINGSDGLMEGNAIIICILFFVLGIRTGAEMTILLSLVLAGGLAGFLFYNFPPAKIFSGSTGKTTLGFLIAVIAILNQTKFAASIMILTLPMIDLFFVVGKRYFLHKPKGFFDLIKINDTNHLHHQLINLGFSPKRVLLVEISITLLIGLVAILTTGAMNLFFFLFIIFLTVIGILTLHVLAGRKRLAEEEKEPEKPESPESKYSY
jgi:UDP-GlcNAc:undecaprenyl-phosphate/decaprenyl-phosphate GlcNAc-1-phosphate transferase